MARRRTHASMVEGENLPEKMSEKAARRFPSAEHDLTLVATPAARRSGGCCGHKGSAVASYARGGEEAKWCGEEERLPHSPIYRGGVVTAPVTTPPGSLVGWDFCGCGVVALARV